MLLVIQNKESNTSIYGNENIVVLKSVCDLKTYRTGQYTILLVDIEIDENGVISKYNFAFEELIITLNVISIITNKSSSQLQNICNYYNIPLIELNYRK